MVAHASYAPAGRMGAAMRLVPLLLLAACATRGPLELPDDVRLVLEEPDEMTLYSLYPFRDVDPLDERERFHSWIVIGKTRFQCSIMRQY